MVRTAGGQAHVFERATIRSVFERRAAGYFAVFAEDERCEFEAKKGRLATGTVLSPSRLDRLANGNTRTAANEPKLRRSVCAKKICGLPVGEPAVDPARV